MDIVYSDLSAALSARGKIAYSFQGASMLPLLMEGRDVVLVEKKGEERCPRLSIIVFKQSDGQLTMHRIVRVLPGGYITAGDHCTEAEKITENQVIGIVREVSREGKTVRLDSRGQKIYAHLVGDLYRGRMLAVRLIRKIKRIFRK